MSGMDFRDRIDRELREVLSEGLQDQRVIKPSEYLLTEILNGPAWEYGALFFEKDKERLRGVAEVLGVLEDIPEVGGECEMVPVRFKNPDGPRHPQYLDSEQRMGAEGLFLSMLSAWKVLKVDGEGYVSALDLPREVRFTPLEIRDEYLIHTTQYTNVVVTGDTPLPQLLRRNLVIGNQNENVPVYLKKEDFEDKEGTCGSLTVREGIPSIDLRIHVPTLLRTRNLFVDFEGYMAQDNDEEGNTFLTYGGIPIQAIASYKISKG
jgi:hypothetical protein